jgi:hypothetical protein
MIANTSEQFGAKPYEQNNDYLKDSSSLTSLFNSAMLHGRMIAKWELSDELILELKGMPAYGLELSKRLIQGDAQPKPAPRPAPKF